MHVAGFAALAAVISAVRAEPYVVHGLAVDAVFLAGAFGFFEIALRAEEFVCHKRTVPRDADNRKAALSGRNWQGRSKLSAGKNRDCWLFDAFFDPAYLFQQRGLDFCGSAFPPRDSADVGRVNSQVLGDSAVNATIQA